MAFVCPLAWYLSLSTQSKLPWKIKKSLLIFFAYPSSQKLMEKK